MSLHKNIPNLEEAVMISQNGGVHGPSPDGIAGTTQAPPQSGIGKHKPHQLLVRQ